MPSGIQVNNPGTNEVQFDTSSRLIRLLTTVQTGTSNGSTPIPPGAQTWAVRYSLGLNRFGPITTQSGGNVNWNFGEVPTNERANGFIDFFFI